MDEFALLLKKIKTDRGFNCEHYKEASLKRRLAIRMKATGCATYGDYMLHLSKNPEEYESLIDTLTVNFTEFYRDPEMYAALADDVIPEIVARKKDEKRRIIRIWSAGCSSGEEPYSLSILLHELLGDEIKNFIVTIKATDIDDRSLEKAKAGLYEIESLKNLSPDMILKYFKKEGEKFRVDDSLRDIIKFEKHDLISGPEKKYFDIVLCRNVFIYFSRDIQKQILEGFYSALNRNGYLVIGKTETMHEKMYGQFKLYNLSERMFKKA